MGWCYYSARYFKNGKIDRKAECDAEFTSENLEVVKSRLVGATWYGAMKNKKTGEIWALVCDTSVDGWDFGYKDMSEDMGPYRYDCPESILKLLSPTDNEWANEWRQKCRDRIAEKKKLNALPVGTQIYVPEFDKHYYKNPGGGRYEWTDGGLYYISKSTLLSCGYEVTGINPRYSLF